MSKIYYKVVQKDKNGEFSKKSVSDIIYFEGDTRATRLTNLLDGSDLVGQEVKIYRKSHYHEKFREELSEIYLVKEIDNK